MGKRVPPCLVTRVADNNPIEIQDLILADARVKIFVFPGDLASDSHLGRLQRLAFKIEGVLNAYRKEIFDIIVVAKEIGGSVTYTDVPPVLRSAWKK